MSTMPEGSRFTEYTPTDHQAPLWIATLITLVYAFLFFAVRLGVKYKVLGLDDAFLSVAHVVGVAQWGVMLGALDRGVGKILGSDDSPLNDVAKLVFASRILALITICLTQCSVLLFLRQIFGGTANRGRTICTTLIIFTCCMTVALILTVGVGCSPSGMLSPDNAQCSGDRTRWIVVVAVEVCLEAILVLIPAYLFYSVHISRTRKLVIFGAFLTRIFVPAALIAYLVTYLRYRKHQGSSLEIVGTLVWQQVLCGYSLVSATTPCLKGFLGRFRTEDLARVTDYSGSRTYGSRSRSKTNHDTYVLESIDRRSVKPKAPKDETTNKLACRSIDLLHSARAYAGTPGDNGDGSVKSFGSGQMMIHRKVEYDVSSN